MSRPHAAPTASPKARLCSGENASSSSGGSEPSAGVSRDSDIRASVMGNPLKIAAAAGHRGAHAPMGARAGIGGQRRTPTSA